MTFDRRDGAHLVGRARSVARALVFAGAVSLMASSGTMAQTSGAAPAVVPVAISPTVFGPYAGQPIEPAKDKVPTAEALVRAFVLDHHRGESKPGLNDRFEVIENRLGGEDGRAVDVMVLRLLPQAGDASSLAGMICKDAKGPIEAQIVFWWDDVDTTWKVLESRISSSGRGCDGSRPWTRGQMDDTITPPHFLKLTPAERGATHTPEAGTPERKAILDVVRAYNRDLNDRVPIVFVDVELRVDDRFAYFAGKARRKSDLAVLPQKIWGLCEQDPQDGVIEALLERKGGKWVVLKGNRCADDVLFTEADHLEHRLLFMPD